MITIVHEKNSPKGQQDLYRPQVTCDICGVEINSEDGAFVEFGLGTAIGGCQRGELSFLHSDCSDKKYGLTGKRRQWWPMRHFLIYLAGNLNISREDLDKEWRRMED